ncbi:MAG: hypothetical protein VXZ82_22745 [Planctomycetota bacterium]|nr:hypothetical protein [Planctomycetota bacterium]
MSAARRKREQLAPSLFPFLAVLLCTMGALVLLLMLIVSDAQVTAKEVAQVAKQRREELQSLADAKLRAQQKQLDDQRFKLEQKRLMLQHYEEHIDELTAELTELFEAIHLAQSSVKTEQEKQEQREKLTELEKQLADAKEKLAQQLDKPDGDKPVFAVIPYEGRNGTHRRPIYLECRADGLLVQPESILVTLENLQPPYGPGNPLDAVLRTIRNEYKPKSGAITRTAYPLLLVRPSGVRTYALARAALSSWDDQFGYELIDNDLDLVFPQGEPGLKEKLASTIELARQRQSALARAMPRKYQPLQGGSGRTGGSGGRGDDAITSLPGGTRHSSGNVRSGNSLGLSENGSFLRIGAPNLAGAAILDRRSPGGENRQGSGSLPKDLLHASQSTVWGNSGSSTGPSSFFGDPSSSLADLNLGAGQQGGKGSADRSESGAAESGSYGRAESYEAPGIEPGGTGDSGQTPSLESFVAQGSGASGGSSETRSANNATGSGPSQSSNSGDPGQTGSGSAAASMMGQSMSGSSPGFSTSNPDKDPASVPQLSLSVEYDKSKQADPVAARRGRNWAWRDGPRTQTPVVRKVHLHCFVDSWVLLPENGDVNLAVTIPFRGTPEQRAVVLAKAIIDWVDSWGLALAGGYWKPVLIVDVAPQAAWRFDQLKRLMEGSGLEIKLRNGTAYQTRAAASDSTSRSTR